MELFNWGTKVEDHLTFIKFYTGDGLGEEDYYDSISNIKKLKKLKKLINRVIKAREERGLS